MICRVTGTIRIATVPTISHVSSRWYSSIKRLMPLRLCYLLDRVDLGQDLVRADFLRVRLDDRVDELLHLRPVGELDPLQLARLLQRLELRGVLARLQLPAVRARLLARLQHRLLHALIQRLERLARE